MEAHLSAVELFVKELQPFSALDNAIFTSVPPEQITPELVIIWKLFCQHLEQKNVSEAQSNN